MSKFWWVRPDLANYKAPAVVGKGMLPDDFLAPGYAPDLQDVRFSFAYGKRDPRLLGDFASPYGSAFFVSGRCMDIFADIFWRSGRVFPARADNETYYFVLIDKVLDAFDLSRSEYETTGEPGRTKTTSPVFSG